MASIGIIYVAYQAEDLVPRSLQPWIDARAARLGGYDYSICAVSVPFEGFDHGGDELDRTLSILDRHAYDGNINHVIVSDKPIKETEARGRALAWLRDEAKVDICVQWDADELAGSTDIGDILWFVAAHPLVPSFRISYRNAVFDEHTFLVEPFTPMRVHRMRGGRYEASSFWDDNNVLYRGTLTRDFKRDIDMATMTIPPTCANPLHLSWLSDERSRRKIKYQRARWGHCSFQWDEGENQLKFDESYFAKMGLPMPEVVRE